jgi:integrase
MASRRYLPRSSNPWRGFRIGDGDKDRAKPKKRPYNDAELVALFSGAPTYPALREVMVLGLYTGARIDEICSLLHEDIRIERGTAYVQISKSKTAAGIRTIAIAHSIPLQIIKSRLRVKAKSTTQLFHELKGGGYDEKLSWHVGQAFRYYRNGQGLTGATDFHSLRRTFITRLENLGVDQVHIARYVGHSLPTLAFKVYSGGATASTQRATARAIHYPRKVEAAVRYFVSNRRK